jgi:hypothetical protein
MLCGGSDWFYRVQWVLIGSAEFNRFRLVPQSSMGTHEHDPLPFLSLPALEGQLTLLHLHSRPLQRLKVMICVNRLTTISVAQWLRIKDCSGTGLVKLYGDAIHLCFPAANMTWKDTLCMHKCSFVSAYQLHAALASISLFSNTQVPNNTKLILHNQLNGDNLPFSVKSRLKQAY